MPTKAEQKRSANAATAFDNYYAAIWGEERWAESLKPALLESTRHASLINTFAPDDEVSDMLQGQPTSIRPYLPPEKDTFHAVRKTANGLMSHYNMDAASILAADLLDVQPDHTVLDLCAAPGGKSIAIAQRRPAVLHSNEVDDARNKRLAANLNSYLPADFNLKVLKLDGTDKRALFPLKQYDRILVDAPCSSERHILHKSRLNPTAEEMMNWKASHTKSLAKTQVALLMNALRLLKSGGKIVYATCSISSEENDGMIERCQQKESFDVIDDESLHEVSEKTKYGRIVLPDHKSGGKWGPLFFCVIVKSKS